MLRTYGPACDGSLIEAKAEKIPDSATWVDLEEPTAEEEALVERCIRLNVPTESEMSEIEPSSRLYERDGALYMTVSVLYGVQDGQPRTAPISFVLADNRLVTVRYATPKPVRAFAEHARRDPELVRDAPTALIRTTRCDRRPACRRNRSSQRDNGRSEPEDLHPERAGTAHSSAHADSAAHPDRPDHRRC